MAGWNWFLFGDTPELADEGESGIVRLPIGAPSLMLAELLFREGDWLLVDIMWRAKYLGSDYEFTPISEERAWELMHHWVQIGRIAKLPPEEACITPEEAAAFGTMDAQADAIWRDVPTPPGVQDIGSES